MQKIITLLQGKKTYILGALAILAWIANFLGFIPPELAESIYVLSLPAGLMTLRAGVSKGT